MAKTEETQEETPKKASKLPLILGLVLALAGGGGGFYAVHSGLLLAPESADGSPVEEPSDKIADMPDVGFVPVDPLIISLDGGGHLRFRAQLEVRTANKAEVEQLMPRVIDVLNSYLRAVDIDDLRSNSALVRLRAQMLRRVQIVTGGDRVSDLLIMEFVLN